MIKRLTMGQLDAIRKRTEAASESPWELDDDGSGVWNREGHNYLGGVGLYSEDAEFIVHAREDVPALLDEIEQMKEDMNEIAEIVSSFYTEQGGIRLSLNLSSIAGELQVIHKIAGGGVC